VILAPMPAAPTPIKFLGVQNFEPWPEHLPDDAARARVGAVVVAAYGLGLVGGLLWGGWRGLVAGWAAAAALKYGLGTAVYAGQPDTAYRNVALLTGGVALVDLAVAGWLGRGVLERREEEGRSAFGLAY